MNTTAHTADQSVPAFPQTQLKVLVTLQWLLTGFGIFCLVGAAMLIALTPEAWPL